jgi:uncharacterized protein
MNETPLFFPAREGDLFGILHWPSTLSTEFGFVLCHPFAEEKLWTHRVYVSLARDLAARGYAVLRFDHAGHGDSDGEFRDSSVDSWLSDIQSGVEYLQAELRGKSQVGLMGLRLGATLAALAAARIPGVGRLVLWEPIIDGGRYMQEVLRSNLASQLAAYGRVQCDRKALVASLRDGQTINVDGYELGRLLYEQVSSIDLRAGIAGFAGAMLILQVGKPEQTPREEVLALAERFERARLQVVHEEPFWREIKPLYTRAERLSAATLAWLDVLRESAEPAHA